MSLIRRFFLNSFISRLMLLIFVATACVNASENMSPLLLAVHDAPVPFMGSDGCVHLIYELWMTNSSSSEISVQKVEVLGDGNLLQTLDATTVAARLQPIGQRQSVKTLAKSTQALLFLNVTLPSGSKAPKG